MSSQGNQLSRACLKTVLRISAQSLFYSLWHYLPFLNVEVHPRKPGTLDVSITHFHLKKYVWGMCCVPGAVLEAAGIGHPAASAQGNQLLFYIHSAKDNQLLCHQDLSVYFIFNTPRSTFRSRVNLLSGKSCARHCTGWRET